MAVQPNLNASLKTLAFPCQNFFLKPFQKASIFARSRSHSLSELNHPSFHSYSTSQRMRIGKLSASASAAAADVAVNLDTLADDDIPSESPRAESSPDKEVISLSSRLVSFFLRAMFGS